MLGKSSISVKRSLYTLFIILIFPHRFRYFGAVVDVAALAAATGASSTDLGLF